MALRKSLEQVPLGNIISTSLTEETLVSTTSNRDMNQMLIEWLMASEAILKDALLSDLTQKEALSLSGQMLSLVQCLLQLRANCPLRPSTSSSDDEEVGVKKVNKKPKKRMFPKKFVKETMGRRQNRMNFQEKYQQEISRVTNKRAEILKNKSTTDQHGRYVNSADIANAIHANFRNTAYGGKFRINDVAKAA
uniref:CP n=1 Tax=Rhododendron betaflexivirus 1 TaxID=2794406 RepID=A0A7T5QZB0_9VIRU|nr:CP [Rhododendron betaflexivirus 1]